MNMNRLLKTLMTGVVALTATFALTAHAADEAPDALVKRLSDDMITTVKNDKSLQAGDVRRVAEVVDAKIVPFTNFERMTAMAVGRNWRTATPEQKTKLQAEFKQLLVRTYAGALSQVKDQSIQLRPFRGDATKDTEVVVRTQVLGAGEPIQLDYRLEKTGDSWKMYDMNVAGVWLVENYKASFANEVTKGGLDGLITTLAERNKRAGEKKSS
jgi:phospholipid transport system substrate-binding protein